MAYVIDSTFVIDLLRSDGAATRKARELDGRREPKLLSTPVLYEVSSGILLRRSKSEAAAFRALALRFTIIPFDESATHKAAEIRAELMRLGRTKSHVDVMIAGIALAGDHALVSRDKDFREIAGAVGLHVESY